MIILEGADASGKTTLIYQLAAEFNLPIVKSYKPRTPDDIRLFHHWAAAAPRTPLLDRHAAISDLVYGPIIRKTTPSTVALAQHYLVDNFLVFCCPPYSTVEKTLHNEQQMDGVADNSLALYKGYEQLMEQLEPQFIYDWTNPRAFRSLCTHIQHYLTRS